MKKITFFKLLLLLGVMQVIAYYFIGSFLTSTIFSIALPQPDTLLYCQSAKQIINGQPFVFSSGDTLSTGCTSHLYPFILALPYWLGMHGDTLLLGGFILNAFFYLLFLFGWYHIFDALLEDRFTKLLAVLLLGLCGQSACSAMGQTDTGLMMAVTALVFASWLKNKKVLFAILLVLSPWCRPEGMMLTLAFGIVIIARYAIDRKLEKSDVLSVLAGGASALFVFIFNYILTGQYQFHSVEFKGYLGNMPFFDAVQHIVQDLMTMVQQLLLGMPGDNLLRSCFILPLIGAVIGWTGFITFNWYRRDAHWKLCGWILASALGFASVASGGWQGTNLDRYLAWLFPTGFIFLAYGISWTSRHLNMRCAPVCLSLLIIGFQCFGAFSSMCWFATTSQQSQLDYETAKSMDQCITSGKTVGLSALGGVAYLLNDKRIKHLSGIYSPQFRNRLPVKNIELLKHEPSARFDFWFFADSSMNYCGADVSGIATNQLFQGLNGWRLFETDWSELDGAVSPNAQEVPEGKSLSARVDVGYSKEELESGFKVNYRLPGLNYRNFASRCFLHGKKILDVGIPVIGWSSMNVALQPEKDLTVILRTSSKSEQLRRDSYHTPEALSIKSPVRLRVFIDGNDAGEFSSALSGNDDEFSEISLQIPGRLITRQGSQVEIFGDHLAFCYWFYQ